VSTPVSPYESNPPSGKKILASVAVALAGAALVLVTIILPAEYNIDPTRIGTALGLTAMHAPARTVQVADVVGGNEKYRDVAIPDFGQPVPLPNPAVFQNKTELAKAEALTITLQPGEQTEIKTALKTSQMILFSWQAEGGQVYTDFHGHDPAAGDEFWVRYEEQQAGTHGQGSLVAPFEGEHGWFWLNVSEQPVTIKLNVNGFFEKIIDYGISGETPSGSK